MNMLIGELQMIQDDGTPDIMALMPLSDLRDQLKRRGIIDVPKSTVRNWYLFGVVTPSGRIKLKTVKVGRRRMSSVAWTLDFLDRQDCG